MENKYDNQFDKENHNTQSTEPISTLAVNPIVISGGEPVIDPSNITSTKQTHKVPVLREVMLLLGVGAAMVITNYVVMYGGLFLSQLQSCNGLACGVGSALLILFLSYFTPVLIGAKLMNLFLKVNIVRGFFFSLLPIVIYYFAASTLTRSVTHSTVGNRIYGIALSLIASCFFVWLIILPIYFIGTRLIKNLKVFIPVAIISVIAIFLFLPRFSSNVQRSSFKKEQTQKAANEFTFDVYKLSQLPKGYIVSNSGPVLPGFVPGFYKTELVKETNPIYDKDNKTAFTVNQFEVPQYYNPPNNCGGSDTYKYKDLAPCSLLGTTRDGHKIYSANYADEWWRIYATYGVYDNTLIVIVPRENINKDFIMQQYDEIKPSNVNELQSLYKTK